MTRVLFLFLVAGCGDDARAPGDAGFDGGRTDGGGRDAAPSDAGADAGNDAGPSDGGPACAPTRLLVTTSDFMTGGLGTFDLATSAVAVAPSPLPEQDMVPDAVDCAPVVLGRGEGLVRVLPPADPFGTGRDVDVDPAGAPGPYATNPQTIVSVARDKAYVVALARNELVIIDPLAATVLGEVDLSSLVRPGDMDGLVDATDAIVVGDTLYVALGNYWFDDAFAIHFEGSVLAIVDTRTDVVMGVIGLTGENPWRGLYLDEAFDALWVGSTGDSFARDGGIEVVDLATGRSNGFLIDEAAAGDEINGFAVVDPATRGYVLVGNAVQELDPADGRLVGAALARDVDGLLVQGGSLYVWSRMGDAPGLRRFDAASGTETTPLSGPWTFGSLPIYGVSVSP